MIGTCVLANTYIHGYETGIAFFIAVMVFLSIVIFEPQIFCSKPMRFIGGISYAIYLTHQNIGFEFLNWLEYL